MESFRLWMPLDQTGKIIIGVMIVGIGIFITDNSVLPQTGSWYVVGEIGLFLIFSALLAGVVAAARRTSRP